MRGMRVAIVSPPWYPVPPSGYGGIEVVVYLLARELLARGHDVTVFAPGGSDPHLNVVALADPGWADDLGTPNQRVREATYLRRVYDRLKTSRFDLIHEHNEYPGIMVAHTLCLPVPVMATVHGSLGERERTFLQEIDMEVGLVAISDSQASSAPDVRWSAVVHNAIDISGFELSAEKDGYLLELARINPDKGQAIAIEVSRRLGMPLVLAGKLDADPRSQAYFEDEVRPHLGERVTWLENVAGEDKRRLLARARAMLFPLQWEEPFGLAMVEAMASGTPVIAFARGAARELVEPGITGFLAADIDEMVDLVGRAGEVDGAACRQSVAARFDPGRMADAYEAAYALATAGNREEHVPGRHQRDAAQPL